MAVGQRDEDMGKGPNWVGRLFTEHPRSLGMSWVSHGIGAAHIALRLIGAGCACLIHALVPGWFTETAGRTVTAMHEDMVRRKAGAANPNAWPDYEI